MVDSAEISRDIELSSYVTLDESGYFVEVAKRFTFDQDIKRPFVEAALKQITEVAKVCFGQEITTEICGSMVKGTNIGGSDVDFYIDTTYAVSLAEREAFTARLKSTFNEHRVGLGRLAIHVCAGICEIDVVCSNTVEYGIRPRPDKDLPTNLPAQQAIRALKSLVSRYRAIKVPGYKLEAMVVAVQQKWPIMTPLNGGGFQLYISVLQSIFDRKSGKIFGLSGGTGSATDLRQFSASMLHLFVASRTVNGCFRNCAEMAGFLFNEIVEVTNTAIGTVPDWILSMDGKPTNANSCVASLFERYKGPNSTSCIPRTERIPHSLKLLATSNPHLAKYTLLGFVEPSALPPDQMIEQLLLLAPTSAVACQMLKTRYLWCTGMEFMKSNDHMTAVAFFGDSLRESVRDGDPFSGYISDSNCKDLMSCAHAVLSVDPHNVDAVLLQATVLMCQSKWDGAISKLKIACEWAPNDAYGALYRYAMTLSNRGHREEALVYYERCLKINPEEPQFHYWVATSLKLIYGNGQGVRSEMQRAVREYERFIELANPEGRKVCQAWYDLAMIRIYTSESHNDGSKQFSEKMKEQFTLDVRNGRLAEKERLSVFPPSDFGSKKLVEILCPPLLHVQSNLKTTSISPRTKKLGDDAFRSKSYLDAIQCYTESLHNYPDVPEVYANRSAAYSALTLYSAALRDAERACELRSDWAKAYLRCAVAHMGLKQPDFALISLQWALNLAPNDASIAELKRQASELQHEQLLIDMSIFSLDACRDADCWEHIQFKDNVKIVNPLGGGDYTNIYDACYSSINCDEKRDCTLVLVPGVHLTDAIRILKDERRVNQNQIQIVGWHDSLEKAKQSIVRMNKYESQKANIEYLMFAFQRPVSVMMRSLVLTNPNGLPFTNVAHCVSCINGSTAFIEKCTLHTPNSPCCTAADATSSVTLVECNVKNSSAIAVVTHDGLFRAINCKFRECSSCAVDIREDGSAELEDCVFSRCTAQAVGMYCNGKKLTMTRCTIDHCGKQPSCSAIFMETGQTVLRDCIIRDSPGDGIVLQERVNITDAPEPPPTLLMSGCTIERNVQGCVFYFGSGIFSNNTVTANAQVGLLVNVIPSGRKLALTGNIFCNNGTMIKMDVGVIGRTQFKEQMIVKADNVFDVPPYVLPDEMSALLDGMKKVYMGSR